MPPILDPPTEPALEAVAFLDQARRVEPTARLACWRLAMPDMLNPAALPVGGVKAASPDEAILASCYAAGEQRRGQAQAEHAVAGDLG